jgi:signal peptidase I
MVPVERVIGRVDWLGWPLGRLGSLEGTDAFTGIRPADADHG